MNRMSDIIWRVSDILGRMSDIIRRGPGEVWWQIKSIGNDGNGHDVTPYSNVGNSSNVPT